MRMSLRERYDEEVRRLRAEDAEYQAIELALAVGAAIRERMETEGVTQADLARRLGVSRSHVSQLLKEGSSNLTLKTLARLAAALDARVAWDFRRLLEERIEVPRWDCDSRSAVLSAANDFRKRFEERQNALAFAA